MPEILSADNRDHIFTAIVAQTRRMPLTRAKDCGPGSRGTIGANTLAKNPIGAVLALSAVSAVALLILNLQPVFIGSVARKFGLNDVELGYFATPPLIASFLVFASAPF
ncbi:MAG: hypothetical protein AAFQ04_13085, partial [Pseudomonadota bacterium]